MQLETARLLLTSLMPQDYSCYQQLLAEPQIRQFNPYLFTLQNEKCFLKWLKQQQRAQKNRQHIQFALRLKHDQRFIGSISLHEINLYHRSSEIGFWLGLPYWRHGYMSEALMRLTTYAFSELNLQRLEAFLLQDNIASANTLKRCGFELEGVFKHKIRFQERFHNILGYARLRPQD